MTWSSPLVASAGKRSYISVKLYREEIDQILRLFAEAEIEASVVADERSYASFDSLRGHRGDDALRELILIGGRPPRGNLKVEIRSRSATVEWDVLSGIGSAIGEILRTHQRWGMQRSVVYLARRQHVPNWLERNRDALVVNGLVAIAAFVVGKIL